MEQFEQDIHRQQTAAAGIYSRGNYAFQAAVSVIVTLANFLSVLQVAAPSLLSSSKQEDPAL